MWLELALVMASYLLGSFPTLYILGRLRGIDLRQEEDMHIAAWRKLGPVEGAAGVLGDAAKGLIAVLIARGLGVELFWVTWCGLAAVAGQMWPIFLKFDGEKGNTIGLGMVAVLVDYRPFLVMLVPVVLGVGIRTIPRLLDSTQPLSQRLRLGGPPSLSLPLGMGIAFALLPFSTWWFGQPAVITLAGLALFVLIMVRRLTADLRKDLEEATNKRSILINRLLYDRSYR